MNYIAVPMICKSKKAGGFRKVQDIPDFEIQVRILNLLSTSACRVTIVIYSKMCNSRNINDIPGVYSTRVEFQGFFLHIPESYHEIFLCLLEGSISSQI